MDQSNGHRRLLTPDQAADILAVSSRTLEGWRRRGTGPPFIRASTRRIRYRPSDIEGWISRQVRTSTSARRPPAEEVA